MSRIQKTILALVILVLSALAAACEPLLTPVRTSGVAPTPVVRSEGGGVEDPDVYVDVEQFRDALLQAIQSRDEALLKRFMADRFVSGVWRGEMAEFTQDVALGELYQNQLGEQISLVLAPGGDLSALMGGVNPLDISRPEYNVIDAILVTGWGKEGADEAILYVSRLPDKSLRWSGTLVIKGGFTSPETGGLQPFINEAHGYQMFLPLGYETDQSTTEAVSILALQGSEGHRTRAIISVEPANGRTAEQMAAAIKADLAQAGLPAEFSDQPIDILGLGTELAVILDRVPAQDVQRMLFVVHEGRLYKMIFIPNDPSQGNAYAQMEDLYAVITNTFKFTVSEAEDGKLVADLNVYVDLLRKALAEHDKPALQSMFGEPFTMAFWQSEGMQLSRDQAMEQILNNYAPAGAQLNLGTNHPVLARLFPEPVKTDAGEELLPVYVSGWGVEGTSEAVLFIARRADGSLYWQGVMTAPGGFGQ